MLRVGRRPADAVFLERLHQAWLPEKRGGGSVKCWSACDRRASGTRSPVFIAGSLRPSSSSSAVFASVAFLVHGEEAGIDDAWCRWRGTHDRRPAARSTAHGVQRRRLPSGEATARFQISSYELALIVGLRNAAHRLRACAARRSGGSPRALPARSSTWSCRRSACSGSACGAEVALRSPRAARAAHRSTRCTESVRM